MPTLIGVYHDNSEVQKVVHDLKMAGIGDEAINLISSVKDRYLERLARDKSSRSPGGAIAMNSVLGGMIGSFAGLALGFFFPLIEPIIVGLIGAVLGAIAGVIMTLLFKWGIADGHIASQIGFAQVEVETPEDRKEQVTEIMEKYDPVSMAERANRQRPEAQENKATGQTSEVSLTQSGDSSSFKAEPRHAGETRSGDIPAIHESIYYNPDRLDDIDVSDNRFPDYEFYLPDFRRHFEQHYADKGSFQDYEPAYRYGYTLAVDYRHNDYDWYDIEPGVRDKWREKYGDTWEVYQAAIKYAWDRLKTLIHQP